MRTLYLDIETTKGDPLHGGRLLLVGWAVDDGQVTTNDLESHLNMTDFQALLGDPSVVKVSHSTYDYRYLKLAGFEVAGPWHDTKVMAWLLNENTPLDIDWLAHRYCGLDMDKRLRRTEGRVVFTDDGDTKWDLEEYDEWPWLTVQEFRDYCGRDVYALRALYKELRVRLQESEWEAYWLAEEVPYTTVLVGMECRGLPVDLEETATFREELEWRVVEARAELLDEAGLPESFNLNSQTQLNAYLFGRHVKLRDRLAYDVYTIEALKSCVDGEHEDCYVDGLDGEDEYNEFNDYHLVDCLPEGFVMEKLGRLYVDGYWSVKGRGLAPTPHTVNKVTGEVGKLPSVSSPELLYAHASDPWVLKLCMGYRKYEKLLTTYLRVFPKIAVEVGHTVGSELGHKPGLSAEDLALEPTSTRIFGRYNQTGTVTGRLSSSDPNMQNMPARGELGKRTRGLFKGDFVIGDYDQLEMRLMAHFSEDEKLVRVFRRGEDPHLITARAIFGPSVEPEDDERGIGKTINFAVGYGAGPKKLAQVLSLAGYATTKDTAAGYLAELQSFYRNYYRWKKHVIERAKRTGSVTTIGGRRRRLRSAFKDTANWKLVGYGERQAVNAIIQGSAADILRRTMVVGDWESEGLSLLAQVHDELIWEYGKYPDDITLNYVRHTAQEGHGYDLRVPLVFEPHIVSTWAAKDGVDELLEEVEDD